MVVSRKTLSYRRHVLYSKRFVWGALRCCCVAAYWFFSLDNVVIVWNCRWTHFRDCSEPTYWDFVLNCYRFAWTQLSHGFIGDDGVTWVRKLGDPHVGIRMSSQSSFGVIFDAKQSKNLLEMSSQTQSRGDSWRIADDNLRFWWNRPRPRRRINTRMWHGRCPPTIIWLFESVSIAGTQRHDIIFAAKNAWNYDFTKSLNSCVISSTINSEPTSLWAVLYGRAFGGNFLGWISQMQSNHH